MSISNLGYCMAQKQVNNDDYKVLESKFDGSLKILRDMRKLDPDMITAFTKGIATLALDEAAFTELEKGIEELVALMKNPTITIRLAFDTQRVGPKMQAALMNLQLSGKSPLDADYFDEAYKAIDGSQMTDEEKLTSRVYLKMMEWATYFSVIAVLMDGFEDEPAGAGGPTDLGHTYTNMRR